MRISTLNYRETFFPKSDLTRILGIPTYYDLHRMQLELKINTLYVHSNLRGAAHGHLRLLMTNNKYENISTLPYVRPVHPGIVLIPNNATCVEPYKLKQV